MQLVLVAATNMQYALWIVVVIVVYFSFCGVYNISKSFFFALFIATNVNRDIAPPNIKH